MTEARFRPARREDLPAIVAMLADDFLGRQRERDEDPLPEDYDVAFAAIDRDPNQHLVVAELDGRVVGCFQLTLIPGLSHQGATRGQIESVRVHSEARGRGLGEALVREAIGRAREAGCAMVQLTTHRDRKDAHRFYERLGFQRTHAGFKLTLEDD